MVDEEICLMLKQGPIQRSNSKYINPVLIVQKGEGRVRLCLDCQKINEMLEDNKASQLVLKKFFGNAKKLNL